MRLQLKVIAILAGVWILTSFMIYGYSRTTLIKNYTQLESREIQTDIKRAEKSLQAMTASLQKINGNWNRRADTYQFMKRKNKPFVNNNLNAAIFENAQINLVLFFDASGKLHYGRNYNLEERKFQMVPANLLRAIEAEKSLSHLTNKSSSRTGLIKVGDNYLIVSALPVYHSAQSQVRGTLVVGYYLNKNHIDSLASMLQFNLTLYTLPITSEDAKLKAIQKQLNSGLIYVVAPAGHEYIAGYTLLRDLNNAPIGILEIEMPRQIYSHAMASINHYIFIEIAIGVVLLLAVWGLLKKYILNRINQIGQQLTDIDSDRKFSQRVGLSGSDELNEMVNAINSLLAIIDQTNSQLKQQLYTHSETIDRVREENRVLETEVGKHKEVEQSLREDEQTLRKLAYYDDLTGLPNRLFFNELVEKNISLAKRHGSGLAILFLDADKFKDINDTYGHQIGDEFLKHFANTLKSSIKDSDIAARLAGDEFIVCLIDICEKVQIQSTVERILTNLANPFIVEGVTIRAGFSVGVSQFPQNATDLNELEQQADLAMYHAKKQGGNSYSFYENITEKESEYDVIT